MNSSGSEQLTERMVLVLTLQQRTSGDATRVFNPYTPSHLGTTLAQRYRRNEQEKKRAYEEKVREVEHGSFSPIIFSTSVGMGPIATVVYKWIAPLIAEKRDQPYSRTLFWICCKLSLVPRPRGRGEKWPGIHCLHMCE